jgi:acyl carrier protein
LPPGVVAWIASRVPSSAFTPSELTPSQKALADLWKEVLQLPGTPSPRDNFFELGGDSMTLTLLEYRIQEEFAVAVPGVTILNCASLADLASIVDSLPQDCPR